MPARNLTEARRHMQVAKLIIAVLLGIILLLMAGCGVRYEQEVTPRIDLPPVPTEQWRTAAGDRVQRLSLDDGTVCILVYQGGIACDFSRTVK